MSKDQESKDFTDMSKGMSSPASVHESLATTTQRQFTDAEIPRSIYCQAAGNLVMIDSAGTTVTYAVAAGQVISFMPAEITATTDIATVIWW